MDVISIWHLKCERKQCWDSLEGPGDILIEQALKFEFSASNNQSKYESLIVGMVFALEMKASRMKAKSDS